MNAANGMQAFIKPNEMSVSSACYDSLSGQDEEDEVKRSRVAMHPEGEQLSIDSNSVRLPETPANPGSIFSRQHDSEYEANPDCVKHDGMFSSDNITDGVSDITAYSSSGSRSDPPYYGNIPIRAEDFGKRTTGSTVLRGLKYHNIIVLQNERICLKLHAECREKRLIVWMLKALLLLALYAASGLIGVFLGLRGSVLLGELILSLLPGCVALTFFIVVFQKSILAAEAATIFVESILWMLPLLLIKYILSEIEGAVPAMQEPRPTHLELAYIIWQAFFIAAFLEETYKFLIIRPTLSRLCTPDLGSIFIYSLIAGTTFSLLENLTLIYIDKPAFQASSQTSFSTIVIGQKVWPEPIASAFLRCLLSTPGHMITAALVGVLLGRKKFETRIGDAFWRSNLYLSVLPQPLLIHGFYNFILSTGEMLDTLRTALMFAALINFFGLIYLCLIFENSMHIPYVMIRRPTKDDTNLRKAYPLEDRVEMIKGLISQIGETVNRLQKSLSKTNVGEPLPASVRRNAVDILQIASWSSLENVFLCEACENVLLKYNELFLYYICPACNSSLLLSSTVV